MINVAIFNDNGKEKELILLGVKVEMYLMI